jgi:hypothetical protein
MQTDTGGLFAAVNYDNQSVAGITAYAAANRTLATQLAGSGGNVGIEITFRSYLTVEQFRTWVAARGVNATETTLRYVDANGRRVTHGIAARPNDVLPQTSLELAASPPKNVGGQRTLRGVFQTSGTVAANRLPDLIADTQVLLLDVTPRAVQDDLIAAGVPGGSQAQVQRRGTPFWQMEDLGLENFR